MVNNWNEQGNSRKFLFLNSEREFINDSVQFVTHKKTFKNLTLCETVSNFFIQQVNVTMAIFGDV